MFFKQVKLEMLKMSWPNRQEVTVTTVMVVVIAIIAAMFFLAADALIFKIIDFILG